VFTWFFLSRASRVETKIGAFRNNNGEFSRKLRQKILFHSSQTTSS
jgi:hypothetical protein